MTTSVMIVGYISAQESPLHLQPAYTVGFGGIFTPLNLAPSIWAIIFSDDTPVTGNDINAI
jgi:hypothetical protein